MWGRGECCSRCQISGSRRRIYNVVLIFCFMELGELKDKLRCYNEEDIVFTSHAEIRALHRGIDLEEVKRNIINPEKLVVFVEKNARSLHEKKYECYFAYSRNFCHKYVLTLNGKVIIVTIIIINRDWQRTLK